jgi:hypothetical protein
MDEALNSPDPERNMYPTWIDEEGKEWIYEPMWECCEYGHFDPNAESCLEPVQYTSGRKQLCSKHFASIAARRNGVWALHFG